MLSTKLKEAAGNSADATLYVDDVFSTYLYTGNGSTQTITNGIDLAGKGGLVWIKDRTAANSNCLTDTARGKQYFLRTDLTSGQLPNSPDLISSFNSNGFGLGDGSAIINASPDNYASWTFRKAAKFFDVVTYTGNGTLLTVNHNLGSTPGMIIVKRTNGAGAWNVYHMGLTAYNYYLLLNTTDAQANGSNTWGAAPTSTTFTVGNAGGGDNGVNGTGNTYVAYLFAHDTAADGIIQCGSFTTDGSGSATVNLGWEPQWLLAKTTGVADDWYVVDSMRGFVQSASDAILRPNTSGAESNYNFGYERPTSSGFEFKGMGASRTYIYMAIRRPNKPPTSGTQVFMPTSTTSSTITPTSAGFPVDLLLESLTSNSSSKVAVDRLRGGDLFLWTNLTNAEQNQSPSGSSFDNNTSVLWKYTTSGYPLIFWNFKRAPGFFDEVCYTGTGTTQNIFHNLTVAPELIINKSRSTDVNSGWPVYAAPLGNNKVMRLNFDTGSGASGGWDNTSPTTTQFTVNGYNNSGVTYVAYLFATLAGISKVGSYTGNGTGQAIACGFSAGARFVLIKRTDAAGDWYTFDSARGLTSGSSPYLLLNSTAAEKTGNNGVYASTGGFTLGATASTTTNINAATYIFLAVA